MENYFLPLNPMEVLPEGPLPPYAAMVNDGRCGITVKRSRTRVKIQLGAAGPTHMFCRLSLLTRSGADHYMSGVEVEIFGEKED